MKYKLILVALLGCLLVAAQAEEHTGKRVAKPQPAAPEPAALPPKTLEQMAAVPPQVSYQGGQLTITARNSTLGDILKAVQAQTGAEIDLPGTGSDRVVGSFGPGPARDVLTALLYGTHFNYVVLGSETDPQSLNRVMLFAKTAAAAQPTPAESASATNYVAPQPYQNMVRPLPGRQGVPGQAAAQAADTDDSADADADDDTTDADADADADADQTDDQADADDQSGENTATVEGQDADQVKTPEQMLQELQQQQVQQQQQQDQQNQTGNQPGFPPVMRPGFPPGMPQPGFPPGVYPPGGMPPNAPPHN